MQNPAKIRLLYPLPFDSVNEEEAIIAINKVPSPIVLYKYALEILNSEFNYD
jgi:hypothetical protein